MSKREKCVLCNGVGALYTTGGRRTICGVCGGSGDGPLIDCRDAELASLRARVAELEAALERISDFEYELYDDHIRLTQGDPEQFVLALEALKGKP